MFEFTKCFCFDLSDSFSCDVELITDFFEGVVLSHIDAETHSEDAFFARCEAGKYSRGDFAHIGANGDVVGREGVIVFDEVAE